MVRTQPDPPSNDELNDEAGAPEGGIAQLGERLLCKQEVVGSIPSASTRNCGKSISKRSGFDIGF